MAQTIPVFSLTRFIGMNMKHEIRDMEGLIVPSGVAKTIAPPHNSMRMPNTSTFLSLAASEFFTNYDKELIDKIRTHRFSIGCWM